jgi:WD40 repeat protein/uncharacterized caspase-like protein
MRYVQLLAFSVCLFWTSISVAQSGRPKAAFQTGFSNPVFESSFEFSPKNNYLIGFNDNAELLLWDIRSSREIKHIFPKQTENPELFYLPDFDFSEDEQYVLIQDMPQGNYFLYNVLLDSVVYTFTPPNIDNGERYTHGKFAADGQSILLISHTPGKNTPSVFKIFSIDGTLRKTCQITLPGVLDDYGLGVKVLTKLIVGKAMRMLNKAPKIFATAVSPNLEDVYFFTPAQKLYHLNLSNAANNSTLSDKNLKEVKLPGMPTLDKLYVSGNDLLAKREQFRLRQQGGDLFIDTLFIFDRMSMRLKNTITGRYPAMTDEQRSNGLTSKAVTLNSTGTIYLDTDKDAAGKAQLTARSVNSGQTYFSMPSAAPMFWYTKTDYQPAAINGGLIVAISRDGMLVAENSREIVIHDLAAKSIKGLFSGIRGQLKLNQPVFLDNHRVFIPKSYNDGFVLNFQNGNIDRLKRTIDCQDTARNGANVYFNYDNTAAIGLQSATASAADKKMAISQFMPNSLCETGDNKTIEVYHSETLAKIGDYKYPDREFTYHLNMIAGEDKKFLVNYKLVDFSRGGAPVITELKIINKKDTFFATNPVYLPSQQSIFSIMSTRTKPGEPDLIFAQFSLDGKLLKSVRHARKKSESEFQTYVYESQISPDGNRLLFCLQDGLIGLFDIKGMKMIRTMAHGEKWSMDISGRHFNFYALSACFIDNDHFVTAGNDFKVILWSVNNEKPERVLPLPHGLMLYGLTVSPDKHYLAGADITKNIRFINLETGQLDLTFSAFNFENYALLTKDGYYMANKKSTSNFNFLYNGRAYDFSQFDVRLNRPDKVLEQLGYVPADQIGYYRKAYEKRIKKMGYTLAQAEGSNAISVPEISVKGMPAQSNVTTAADLSFSVTGSDKQLALSRLHVSVNGVPLYGMKGLAIKQSSPGSITLPVKVPLSYGKNQLSVSVANSQGIESIREFITITRKEEAYKPDLYLVSIGAATYMEKNKNLKYAAKDAADIQRLFAERRSEFGAVVQQSLVNEKVTRTAVLKLKDQLRKSKPNDVVVLFYAGHGVLDQQLNYYLGTYNMDFANPSKLGIGYEELEDLLDSIPARNKLLLIDACHSGEVDKELVAENTQARTTVGTKVFRNDGIRSYKEVSVGLANSFQLMRSLFPDLRRSSGASVISAAGATEYAVEGEQWTNGVFTYTLLSGLKDKKADMDKDGKIYLSELQEYLQMTVKEITGGQQQPTSRSENLANNFCIW